MGNITETQRVSRQQSQVLHRQQSRSLPPITDPDEPLHLNSLGVIRLVAFLENEFGCRIEDEELIADNFAALRQLDQLLATKTPTEPISEAKLPSTV
jgi:acyl carrier protein